MNLSHIVKEALTVLTYALLITGVWFILVFIKGCNNSPQLELSKLHQYDPRGLNTVHEAQLPHNTLRVKLTREEEAAIQRLENEE